MINNSFLLFFYLCYYMSIYNNKWRKLSSLPDPYVRDSYRVKGCVAQSRYACGVIWRACKYSMAARCNFAVALDVSPLRHVPHRGFLHWYNELQLPARCLSSSLMRGFVRTLWLDCLIIGWLPSEYQISVSGYNIVPIKLLYMSKKMSKYCLVNICFLSKDRFVMIQCFIVIYICVIGFIIILYNVYYEVICLS